MTKQHILEMIRRTAAENGGTPLGWRLFRKATGIKESDLIQFWPRYGNAVREAGHAPNVLARAYGEPVLIQKLVLLIREIGTFPADSDLRFKKNNDSTFPSASLFDRHLGDKMDRIKKVLDYCKAHPGHDDVARICEGIPTAKSKIIPAPDLPEPDLGFVYLLKSGRHYKIGRTNSVGRREREITIQLPEKATLVHEISTDDPTGIESYWHKRFSTKRQNGEWFALDVDDVRAFKRRTFM